MRQLQYAAIAVALFFIGFVAGVYAISRQTIEVQSNVFSCPSWITATYSSSLPKWGLKDCVYQDETQSGGGTSVFVTVDDEFGSPLSGIVVHQLWPDGNTSQTTLGGVTSFPMGPSGCDPAAGRPGALSYYVESQSSSDMPTGFCLPLNRHVQFFLTFQRVVKSAPPTITPTPGNITPSPSIYVTKQQLIDILQYGIDHLK